MCKRSSGFAAKQKIPVARFKHGESKEEVARRYTEKAERDGRFGVVMIACAGEGLGVAGVREGRLGVTPAGYRSTNVVDVAGEI